ncbi:MAG: ATP-binding protein [Ilumatobacteraceae bacterium]
MDDVGGAAPDIRFGFDHSNDAPRRARQAVQGIFGDEHDVFTENVRLAASEMVTNVILHTEDGGELRVYERLIGRIVRLEVEDHNRTRPTERLPSDDHPTGRGLRIIAEVSRRWGVLGSPAGKVVWAEFERPFG